MVSQVPNHDSHDERRRSIIQRSILLWQPRPLLWRVSSLIRCVQFPVQLVVVWLVT